MSPAFRFSAILKEFFVVDKFILDKEYRYFDEGDGIREDKYKSKAQVELHFAEGELIAHAFERANTAHI